MKRIGAYIVLLVFVFNIFGYYLSFEVKRQLARKEIQECIAKSPKKIVVFEFSAFQNTRDLVWIHKKEFRYKGAMYDVVGEKAKGNSTLYYCLRDMKEELLIAAFSKVNKSKFSNVLSMHIVKIALPRHRDILACPVGGNMDFPALKEQVLKIPATPEFPPPKTA